MSFVYRKIRFNTNCSIRSSFEAPNKHLDFILANKVCLVQLSLSHCIFSCQMLGIIDFNIINYTKFIWRCIMKKIILGMVLGFILGSASLILVAATAITVKDNAFPIIMNGKEVKLAAKNLNGSTYLNLRDASALFNAEIEFKNKTIYITSSNVGSLEEDGLRIYYIDKTKYVLYSDVERSFAVAGIKASVNESNGSITLTKNGVNATTKYLTYLGKKYITFDFYEKSIMPLLK